MNRRMNAYYTALHATKHLARFRCAHNLPGAIIMDGLFAALHRYYLWAHE
jgi:hypothetical protein